MLKLKQQIQQKEPAAAEATPATATTETKENPTEEKENVLSLKKKGAKKAGGRTTAGELRAQRDVSELGETPGIQVEFPDPSNIMHFKVTVKPEDGPYKGAEFKFTINITNTYPYDPPKVQCDTLVYHPNIDYEGHVCLNILRQDWRPVLSLGSVLFGLMTLFLEPNPDDPLNKEAAKLMIEKPSEFQRNVHHSLRGGSIAGKTFPKLIK